MQISLDVRDQTARWRHAGSYALPLSVGRVSNSSSGESLLLPDERVSRVHTIVRALGADRVEVSDQGSTNGTVVAGERLRGESARLSLPGEFEVGPYALRLRSAHSAATTMHLSTHRTSKVRHGAEQLRALQGQRGLASGDQTLVVGLPELEFRFLSHVLGEPGPFVRSHEAGDAIWGAGGWEPYMLHNLVRRVRTRLEDLGLDGRSVIQTGRGGYVVQRVIAKR